MVIYKDETTALQKQPLNDAGQLLSLAQNTVPEIIAGAVVNLLSQEKPGSMVGFYGCGRVARLIVKEYPSIADTYRLFFIETNPSEKEFMHFPLYSPEHEIITQAHRIFLLSAQFGQQMLENLQKLPREKIVSTEEAVAQLPYETAESLLLSEYHDLIQIHVDRITRISRNNRPTVFFALPGVVNEALKLMYFIKNSGWNVILFTTDDKVNNAPVAPFQTLGYFDHLVVAKAYATVLLFISRKITADIIHFDVGVGPGMPVAQLIQQSDIPVIVRYLDIKELVFFNNEQAWLTHTGEKLYELEKKAAEVIFTKSAGIVYKDSPRAVDFLENHYHHKPRKLYFPTYPSGSFSPENDEVQKLSSSDGALHLVYCGLLFNGANDKLRRFFQSILTAAEILAGQSIHLTAYNGLDHDGDGYEEYTQLDRKLDFFHYRCAERPDQIPRTLSRYDFAYFCFDQELNPDSTIYKQTTFGSKIFTYLEAGLPIIISEETGFMASFVVENDIGISVSWCNLKNLRKIIEHTDWDRIRRSIQKKRQSWRMEAQINHLLSFYRDSFRPAPENKATAKTSRTPIKTIS